MPTAASADPIVVDSSSLINVQFAETSFPPATQQYAGAAVFGGSTGNSWNLIGDAATGNDIPLSSASGAPTGATVSYSTSGGFFNTGAGGIFGGTPQQALMTSYLFAQTNGTGAPGRVTIGGLTPNAYYQVLPYSAANDVGRGTTFTVGAVQQTVTPTATPTLALGRTFGEFAAQADASGNISLSMTSAGTGVLPEANLNGLQIVPIPVVAAHDLINVQFGLSNFSPTTRYNGPGVVSSVGRDNWNLITDATNATTPNRVALVDAAGSATSASLSYSPLNFFNVASNGVLAGTPEQALLTSYAFADTNNRGGPAVFTLSGLNAGESYELILDSAADDVGRQTLFDVNGVTQVVAPSGAQVQGLGDSFAEYIVAADMAGDIVFSMAAFGDGGDDGLPEADLNGIQLIALPSSIPESSTVLLFAAALGSMVLVRRRNGG